MPLFSGNFLDGYPSSELRTAIRPLGSLAKFGFSSAGSASVRRRISYLFEKQEAGKPTAYANLGRRRYLLLGSVCK